MGITIGSSLNIADGNPVDTRLVLTKAEMAAMRDMKMPHGDIDKYFCLCMDDGQIYVYDKDTTPSTETGRFTKLEAEVAEVPVSKLQNEEGVVLILDGGEAPQQD